MNRSGSENRLREIGIAIPGIMVVVLLWCVFALGGCAPTREPWVGFDFWRSYNRPPQGRGLTCALSEVDDIADVWIINALTYKTGYFSPAVRAEWRNFEGRAAGDLTRHLDRGTNYIVFTLFNKVYEGPSLYKTGGKYKCRFQLLLDNRLIYEKNLLQTFNEKRLIFAAVFKADYGEGGLVSMVPLTGEEKEQLMKVVRTGIARVLHETSDTAIVDWNNVVNKVIAGTPGLKREMEKLDQILKRQQ